MTGPKGTKSEIWLRSAKPNTHTLLLSGIKLVENRLSCPLPPSGVEVTRTCQDGRVPRALCDCWFGVGHFLRSLKRSESG
jgi:hypothetical protein